MTSTPQISIVMPCYQQVKFLEEAVRSVLDQEDVDLELLVMDPGSTDGSRELLHALRTEYGDSLQLHFAPDDGQADAINRGMDLARGNILGWINSDDRLRPGSLAAGYASPGWKLTPAGFTGVAASLMSVAARFHVISFGTRMCAAGAFPFISF